MKARVGVFLALLLLLCSMSAFGSPGDELESLKREFKSLQVTLAAEAHRVSQLRTEVAKLRQEMDKERSLRKVNEARLAALENAFSENSAVRKITGGVKDDPNNSAVSSIDTSTGSRVIKVRQPTVSESATSAAQTSAALPKTAEKTASSASSKSPAASKSSPSAANKPQRTSSSHEGKRPPVTAVNSKANRPVAKNTVTGQTVKQTAESKGQGTSSGAHDVVTRLKEFWPRGVAFDLKKVEFKNIATDAKGTGMVANISVNGKQLTQKDGKPITVRGERADQLALAVFDAKS